jgi:nucleoside-diphosphate-sugar epimerase
VRVLIVGGTRFTGPHTVRGLMTLGHDVAVFHRGRSESELPPEVLHIHGDRSELLAHAGAIRRFAPDVVLDMCAMTQADAEKALAVTVGTARRLVVASSADVYRAYDVLIGHDAGPLEPVPIDENASLRSRLYPYRGASARSPDDPQLWMDEYDKILVERVVMGSRRIAGTVLRLPMMHGPGDAQHRWYRYLKRMDDGRPSILMGEAESRWRTCLGYVENMAAAITRAVVDDRAAGRIYNVADSESPPLAAWIQMIGAAAGWTGGVVSVPAEQLPQHLASEVRAEQDLTLDTTRIRTELDFAELVSLDEALRRTVGWEREHAPQEAAPTAQQYAAEDDILTIASGR